MAMTKCRECGSEISTKAEACPKCGAKRKSQTGCGTLIMASVVGLIVLAAIGRCSSNTAYAPPTTSTTSSHLPSTSSPLAAQPAAPPQPKVGSQWIYTQDDDPMGKGTSYFAAVRSTNTVDFSFPYAGLQHATLTLRTHPRFGKNVILAIERGQFLCPSYAGCAVLVRFDDSTAIKFSAVGASDNSTETIFIEGYARFISQLAKAKRVRVSTNIYQEGAPVFEFDVSGFDGTKYIPPKSH